METLGSRDQLFIENYLVMEQFTNHHTNLLVCKTYIASMSRQALQQVVHAGQEGTTEQACQVGPHIIGLCKTVMPTVHHLTEQMVKVH